jgi:hypothetical protein
MFFDVSPLQDATSAKATLLLLPGGSNAKHDYRIWFNLRSAKKVKDHQFCTAASYIR